MSYDVLLKQFDDQQVMYIPKSVLAKDFKEIRTTFDTLTAYIIENRAECLECFMLYRECDDEIMNVDCCIAVSKLLQETNEIKAMRIQGDKYLVVETICKGSYQKLSKAWNDLITWVFKAGYSLVEGPPFWEIYLNSPKDVKESELLTKLIVPVVKQ
jgi:effector-binding domain-containing protein